MSAIVLAISTTTTTKISDKWDKLGRLIQNPSKDGCVKHTWFVWNNATSMCECGPMVRGMTCNCESQQVQVTVLTCMTYDNSTGNTTVGDCPFVAFSESRVQHHSARLPKLRDELNDAVCGKANREGLLCSKCKPGYGPSVLSYGYPCAKCSGSFYGWLLYFAVVFLTTATFFLVIVLCQIRIMFPPFNLLVFTCQITAVTMSWYPNEFPYPNRDSFTGIFIGTALTIVTSFNLDFFRFIIPPFCISENLSNFQVLCMDYIVAFSPLLLIVVVYTSIQQHAKGCRVIVFLWKPFACCFKPLIKKFNWNPLESIVHIFSSFLLLSSTKFLFVSISLFKQAHANTINDADVSMSKKILLYYDPNITLFGQHHLPYAVLTILVCTTFVILPCLVLCLYPTRLFQECLNLCGLRWHAVHAFADVFNGCYKDGSNGTRDCRYFAGFYFLLRIWLIVHETMDYQDGDQLFGPMFAIVSVVTFALASPYKNRLYNVIETYGLTLGVCRLCFHNIRGIFNVAIGVFIAAYFIGFVCCKITLKLNCRGPRKLKAFADKWSGSSVPSPTGRRVDDAGNNLPDRVANPEGYRLLSETTEGRCDSQSNVNHVPTYGII